MKPTSIVFNEPIHLGFFMLKVSKTYMHDFCYNLIEPRYGDKVKCLYIAILLKLFVTYSVTIHIIWYVIILIISVDLMIWFFRCISRLDTITAAIIFSRWPNGKILKQSLYLNRFERKKKQYYIPLNGLFCMCDAYCLRKIRPTRVWTYDFLIIKPIS